MKIGILSVNTHTKGLNFACPVHTYAFQQFLALHGIDSVVIDYKASYYDNFNPVHPCEYYEEKYKGLLEKTAETPEEQDQLDRKRGRIRRLYEGYTALYRERETRYQKFEDFIHKYYTITDVCYDPDLLEILDPGCDCYVCATDVVWKKEALGFDRGYFLGSRCMENKWKLAYSASRGVPKPYTEEEKQLFFHYLSDIDRISVREASLKEYIEENSDLTAELVIDPVLFHGKEFYSRISVKPDEEHYILLYYAEERSRNTLLQAVKCARRTGLKIIELTNLPISGGLLGKYEDVKSSFRYDVGPDEWIGLIQHADYVFTNSFHTCCFCIIFGKKFFAGSRHGDKLTSFLTSLNLQDRILPEKGEKQGAPVPEATEKESPSKDESGFSRLRRAAAGFLGFRAKQEPVPEPAPAPKQAPDFDAPVDFSEVERLLAPRRAKSIDFLLTSIRDMEGRRRPVRDYDSWKQALTYRILYNSRLRNQEFEWDYPEGEGTVVRTKNGSFEFTPAQDAAVNNGASRLRKNGFRLPGRSFLGWNLRLRIDTRWFWYLEDGSLRPLEDSGGREGPAVRLFAEEEAVPYIPVNHIAVMVAEAVWRG